MYNTYKYKPIQMISSHNIAEGMLNLKIMCFFVKYSLLASM